MLKPVSDTVIQFKNEQHADNITVAVLPFSNLSSDKNFDHLCSGMSLDLVTDF